MIGFNTLWLALRAIRRNLMRSVLTTLGIVIGVAAVVTMVTVGNGATRAVQAQIESLGSNLLMVRPGQRLGPGSSAAGAPPFKLADVQAVATQIGGVAAVAPEVRAGDPIGLGGSGFRPNAEVTLSWADGRGDPVTITTDDTGGFLYQLPTRATEAVGHRTLVATSGDQLTRADVRVLRNPRVATPRPVPD